MRKQYKFIKHSKTDRYKSLKLADIESATTRNDALNVSAELSFMSNETKVTVQSDSASYHNQAVFRAGMETIPLQKYVVYPRWRIKSGDV